MGLNDIRIKNTDGITTEVTVDGHIIEHKALTVETDSDTRIPRVAIYVDAKLDIEIQGVATIVREPTVGEVMRVSADWLEGLDAASVRTALESRAQTMRSDPVAAIIKCLAAAAREVAD